MHLFSCVISEHFSVKLVRLSSHKENFSFSLKALMSNKTLINRMLWFPLVSVLLRLADPPAAAWWASGHAWYVTNGLHRMIDLMR